MRRAADFQSGLKSDRLKASNTAINLNEHMLSNRQAWASYQGTPAMKTKLGLLLLMLLIAVAYWRDLDRRFVFFINNEFRS
jgi:hypothetical protein